jgi:hypothetical protein
VALAEATPPLRMLVQGNTPMGDTLTQEALQDVLAEHLDALIRGEDPTDDLLASYPSARDLLRGLMNLAQRIQAVLVPVQPDAAFVRDLKCELIGVQPPRRAYLRLLANLPPSLKVAGAVGGIAIGAGISFIALRPLLAALYARLARREVAAGPMPVPVRADG